MSTDLPPYPAMKDSGESWLGKVPAHWAVLPSRALFAEVRERGYDSAQMLSVTIGNGVIRQADLLRESAKKDSSNEDKGNYKLVRPGDIAYNKMRAWQGALGVSRYRGIISPAYVVMRPRAGQDPRYFHYLLRTPAFAKEAERWSYGITSDQWSLRPEHFRMIYCACPPHAEQKAIVRFLDYVDGRIRRYMRAKQRLITLLEEQKQATIHRAVTRGLEPTVRLKPSGVEWLGDVPEHWAVVPLKRRWSVIDCKHVTVPFIDEGIPLVSVREVQGFDVDVTTSNRTTSEWYERLVEGGRRPRQGDLIFCRNVSVGACAYVHSDTQLALGQDVCLIRSASENGRFLNYFMHSPPMARQLSLLMIGSTFNRINVSEVKDLTVVVPPSQEQAAIAAYLDSQIARVAGPLHMAYREITLMQEYHKRLITDVITGKVDVRAAVASLPDEVDESGFLDNTGLIHDVDTLDAHLDATREEVEA